MARLRAGALASLIAAGAGCATIAAAAPPIAALPDPTRPPAPPAPATSALPRPAAASSPQVAASKPVVPPTLQAVFLQRGGDAGALVDNRFVRAGDRIGEHVIVTIDAQGLVVRAANTLVTERLWLLGVAPKQPPGSIALTGRTSFSPEPQPGTGTARAGAGSAPVPAAGAASSTLPALAVAEKGKP